MSWRQEHGHGRNEPGHGTNALGHGQRNTSRKSLRELFLKGNYEFKIFFRKFSQRAWPWTKRQFASEEDKRAWPWTK